MDAGNLFTKEEQKTENRINDLELLIACYVYDMTLCGTKIMHFYIHRKNSSKGMKKNTQLLMSIINLFNY